MTSHFATKTGTMVRDMPNPARPNLQLLREGNPGHRTRERLERGLKLPPAAPPEPDWTLRFGPVRGDRRLSAEATRARERARREWRLVVPVLDAMGMLASIDAHVLEDWCTLVARLDQCERDITRRGLILEATGRRNPATMAAQGIRQRITKLEERLGLTPLARDQLRGDTGGAAADDVESPFDV
jgi:P27 family predicted phage terminase small subunit